MYFVKESGMTKNVIRITEFGGLDLSQQYLDFRGDNFDADIRVHILHKGIERVPMIRETVENLDNIFQVTQQPIADIVIMVPTTKNLSHYLELVKALSDKYKVLVVVGLGFG
jgi:hypothetical protein